MTALVQFALPLAELAALGWLRRRVAWTRYPALMAYLATEAGWHLAIAAGAMQWATRYGQPARMTLRALVVIEVFRFACVRLTLRERCRVIAAAAGASGLLAAVMHAFIQLTPWQSFFAFRQYFHLILAGAVGTLAVRVRRRPVMENRDHKAYRYGMLGWFTVLAVAGTFVKGGLGYMVFEYSRETWEAVNVGTYAALLLNLGWFTRRMARNPNIKSARFAADDPLLKAFMMEMEGKA